MRERDNQSDLAHAQLYAAVLVNLRDHDPKELSENSGVSLATVYNWRNNPPGHPQARTVFALAKAMGMNPRVLFRTRQYKRRQRRAA